jgi:hypothetical protein
MTETLVQIIFGWPAVITSILLSVIGVVLKKPALLVTAGIVCIPFAYYISNGFRNPAVFLPLFQFALAYTLTRDRELMAWLLITPLIIVSVTLAYAVWTQ